MRGIYRSEVIKRKTAQIATQQRLLKTKWSLPAQSLIMKIMLISAIMVSRDSALIMAVLMRTFRFELMEDGNVE